MEEIIRALEKLRTLRSQSDDRMFQWNPDTVESWRNDVQEALRACGILKVCQAPFDSIPPGGIPFYATASMVDSSFHKSQYTDSDVQEFLKNGIGPAKQLLDAIISGVERGLKKLEEKYNELVIKRIEEIIKKGPNRG